MKMKRFASLFLAGALTLAACTPEPQEEVVMVVETTMGTVEFKLYNETPLHRDNFIKLADAHYFDSLLFHRVIDNFVIQGGDPNSRSGLVSSPSRAAFTVHFRWKIPLSRRNSAGTRQSGSPSPSISPGCAYREFGSPPWMTKLSITRWKSRLSK